MAVLADDVLADLDDALLAARWARAVQAGNAALVAAVEAEFADRHPEPFTILGANSENSPDKRAATLARYKELAAKAAENAATGNLRKGKGDGGKGDGKKKKTSGTGKGFNPNRKGKGPGGGQFTTADDSQANKDAAVDEAKAATKAETDAKKALAAKKKALNEQRRAEDEADRRAQFDQEEADRRADADAKAATQARREARAAKKAVEAAEDEDLATRIKANTAYEAAKKGEVTLMTRQLAEARQLGNDADEIKLTNAIAAANAEIDKTRADRRALDAEKAQKSASRAQSRAQEAADEQKAASESSEQTRAREAAQRVAREEARRKKSETRAAEDAGLQAEAEELDRRIEAARVRERQAQDIIPFDPKKMKSYEGGIWRDANGKIVGYADQEDGPIRKKRTP